jgi:hypothetical protein
MKVCLSKLVGGAVVFTAVFFVVLTNASCSPGIEVVELGGGGNGVPEGNGVDNTTPYIPNYAHNSEMYGTWFHDGHIEFTGEAEPDGTPYGTSPARWMLALERNNTWRIAYLEKDLNDVPDASEVFDQAEAIQDVEGGFTKYVYFASGNLFEFNGKDEIVFTINSTFEIEQLVPSARGTVKIESLDEDKCTFIPTYASGVRFSQSGRLDIAFDGDWERK